MTEEKFYLPHESFILSKKTDERQFNLKKIINPYNEWKNNKLLYPYELEIHLTNKCILKCKDCSYKSRRDANELQLDVVKRIINSVASSNVRSIFFSGGGDPLSWNNWNELLDYYVHKEMNQLLGIATNILGLKKRIANPELITFYQVHLTGYDEESYFIETGLNCYNEYIKDLEFLFSRKSKNTEVAFKILVSQNNEDKLNSYFDIIEYFKPDVIVFKLAQNFLNNDCIAQKRDLCYLPDMIAQHNINKIFKLKINNLDDDYYYNGTKPKECYIVTSNLYSLIRPDGNIYPCIASTYDSSNSLGNINTDDLSEILKNHNSRLKNSNNMKNQCCPTKACRHYRFNQFLEDYFNSNMIHDKYDYPNLI